MLQRRWHEPSPSVVAVTCFRRLPEADVLLTSSCAFAHHLQTRNHAPQICYCHSPLRFTWSMTDSCRAEWAPSWPAARALNLLAASLRASDRRSAQRVAHFLTQSPFTADQIDRCYGRRAEVIGAPVDTELFRPGGRNPTTTTWCAPGSWTIQAHLRWPSIQSTAIHGSIQRGLRRPPRGS